MRIVSPKAYQPTEAQLEATDADITVTDDLDGVVGADIVYTDVWVSMGQEDERAERMVALQPYQVNEQLLAHTRNPDILLMHCLPAHRGEEISDGAADGKHSLLFPQAHNRLHAQKALLAHLIGHVSLM